MKTKILILFVFAAGIFMAAAQSNPSSTNGVDMEMPLPWPNGGYYLSSFSGTENTYFAVNWSPTFNSTDEFDANWSYAGGGTGVYGPPLTNNMAWAGAVWPDMILTNPAPPGGLDPFQSGSVDFTYHEVPDDYYTMLAWQWTEQGQITLVTGGLPGTTGNEIFCISYSAQNWLPTFDQDIPPQQIQVSGLGSLDTNGDLYVSLPLHTTLSITPNMNSSGLNNASPGVQPYQLVSQCVSPIPSNQARTTIGVGEQVNLSFSPTLPINAIWKTTAGTLSSVTNTSTQFTAPASAGSATVTASVRGQPPVGITFNVVAPSGIDHAVIVNDYSNADDWYNASYLTGDAGAGMDLNVYVAPTNVSFYRVCIMEVPGPASNITGYFTTNSVSPHGTEQGAGEWTPPLSYANQFQDTAASFLPGIPPPWAAGGFDWVIPSEWQVQGSSVTNSFTQWTESFRLLDANGDFSTSKFGQTVTRTTNDVVTQ